MKKKDWISIGLIIACIAVLLGYRVLARVRADHTPPQIHMDGNLLEISALEPRTTLLQGVTATDNRDGDVTGSLVVESVRLLHRDGTVSVTYAAFDKEGNVAKDSREARFTDYESPKFSLSQPLMFSQTSSYDVLSIINASDMLDGKISHRIRATILDEVDAGHSGTHHIQFRVTNSLGEMVELVLPVEVYTPSLFEGSLTLTDYLIYLQKGDSFNARSYVNSFAIGRESLSLRNGLPEGVNLIISGKADTNVPGVYVIDYQVTCEEGAQTYTAYSRLIVVVEE